MIRQILLADDDADDRMMFEEVFSGLPDSEYKLHCMEDGEEVVAFLQNIDQHKILPDLIILDQNMPVKSGKDTLEYIKTKVEYSSIPVVIYSTYNENSFIEECVKLGVNAVVSKPDSYEGYINMINNLLKYCRRAQT
jgi:CheY-like chemotaxis protein